MVTFPDNVITLRDLETGFASEFCHLRIPIDAGEGREKMQFAANLRISDQTATRSLVVFLPAAQQRSKPRRVPFIQRWRWYEDLPSCSVMSIADPVLSIARELVAAWFIHRDIDVMKQTADIIQHVAKILDIPNDSILFYGSSLGGFASLCLASCLPGSRSIAEIPQIEIRKWPVSGSLKEIENTLNLSLENLESTFPERLNVYDRFKKEGYIPPFEIITNTKDQSFYLQVQLLQRLEYLSRTVTSIGTQRITLVNNLSGHEPLSKAQALRAIQQNLALSFD